jgi:putative endonuclease
MKQPAVYMMANYKNGAIYIGVTSNLEARNYQHKSGDSEGFTKRYGCTLLVWYEIHETMESAILREKQIKGGSRKKKLALIEKENREWNDLSGSW